MFSAKLFYALETKTAIGRIYILERTYVVHNSTLLTNEKGSKFDNIKLPESPTNCCMSGCANCVWIEYAAELTKLFKDSGEKSKEIIMEKIDDPNMKAFLLTELSFLKSKDPS